MCWPGVWAANPLFSLWRALWHPMSPASRTKRQESRTRFDLDRFLCALISVLNYSRHYCKIRQQDIFLLQFIYYKSIHHWKTHLSKTWSLVFGTHNFLQKITKNAVMGTHDFFRWDSSKFYFTKTSVLRWNLSICDIQNVPVKYIVFTLYSFQFISNPRHVPLNEIHV